MSVFLNVGSLVFGLMAWIIPIVFGKKSARKKRRFGLSIMSFTCCSTALVLQMFELKNRVNIGDLSAVMDTIGAISWVSLILVVITVIFNVFAFSTESET